MTSEHTDVATLSRRAEELCSEARRLAKTPRRSRGAPPSGRYPIWGRAAERPTVRDDVDYAYLVADFRSSSEGRRLGRQFGHNPYALARALGVAVDHVPLAQLQRPGRPNTTFLGRLWKLPNRPFVQLAQGLAPHEDRWTLCHEIGHFLNFPDERLCSQFADAFMEVDEDETAAGRWAIMQRELLARARRRAQYAHSGGLRYGQQ